MKKSWSTDFQKAALLRPIPSHGDLATVGEKPKVVGATSWVCVDANGVASVVEIDKSAIMQRVGIHGRDLRILDPLLSHPATILGRERAIVMNVEHIKAIITADEVFLRNPSSESVQRFVEELQRRVASHSPRGPTAPSSPNSLAIHRTSSHMRGVDEDEGDEDEEEDEEVPEDLPLTASITSAAESGMREVGSTGLSLEMQILVDRQAGVSDADVVLGKSAAAANAGEEAFMEPEPDDNPFEFQALEVALEAVCLLLERLTMELENAAYPTLDQLTSKISSLNLERARKLKSSLSRLIARVNQFREQLEQLLDDDGDMAEMFLTRKVMSFSPEQSVSGGLPVQQSPSIGSRVRQMSRASTYSSIPHDVYDVEELEQLLESYFTQIDGTLNKLNTLREYVDDTEDYINIQLDNHRNQLIQLELVLSMATFVVSIYGVVAGIFGMNVPYSWNDHPEMFNRVVFVSLGGCVACFVGLVGFAHLRGVL
eukprot:TRINITY_DN17424_c0_g1_i1.p1 TRINITY_DN17424_c0_g1~~TRINITY_DN17424_c0_g1_i1.p1  ORF type:complete len:485 (+),score=127.18 TRINITY_DN17424_c0_g1_i1:223-1677(+)